MGYVHGEKWDEEKIKSKVLEVVKGMNLNRMPTESECRQYFKSGGLSSAISRRMGWRKLAEELNLDIKESETYFGKRNEEIAKEDLNALGYDVRRMSTNFPYDLFLEDCIKIDVKASRLYKGVNGNFYTFNLEKPYSTCDIYLLYLIKDDGKPKDILVLPSKFVPTHTQISVGEKKSKYYKYSNKWEYIDKYLDFMLSVS